MGKFVTHYHFESSNPGGVSVYLEDFSESRQKLNHFYPIKNRAILHPKNVSK